MRIAYQGEPGAYSEAAALRFRPSVDLLPCGTFEAVFAAVEQGRATHGILPIENSSHGTIHGNYDLLLKHELPIVGEVKQPIVHNLLALEGTAGSSFGGCSRTPKASGSASGSSAPSTWSSCPPTTPRVAPS